MCERLSICRHACINMHTHACTHTHACLHTRAPPHTQTYAHTCTHTQNMYINFICANSARFTETVILRNKVRGPQHLTCKAWMDKQDGRLTSWCFHRDFLCVTVNSVIPTCNKRHEIACETWLFTIPDIIIIKYPYCSSQRCKRKIVFSYTIVAGT